MNSTQAAGRLVSRLASNGGARRLQSWLYLGVERIFALPRPIKRYMQGGVDGILVAAALAISMAGYTVWSLWVITLSALLGGALSVMMLRQLEIYRSFVRYISRSFVFVAVGLGLGLALLFAVLHPSDGVLSAPLLFAHIAVLSSLAVVGPRTVVREVYQWRRHQRRKKVLIYGAGEAGRQLLRSLRALGTYRAVGFVDDDHCLQGWVTDGLKIHAPQRVEELVRELGIDLVLLALPSVSHVRRAEILRGLEHCPAAVKTVPPLQELVAGGASIVQLQDVRAEDLLARHVVAPVAELIEHDVRDRSVLVSGAGGSIGSELARQVIAHRPRRVVLVEMNEFGLYSIEKELRALSASGFPRPEVVACLGDVAQPRWLEDILRHHGVETFYHAAAYKHVPLLEVNQLPALRNNACGTFAAAEAALAAGVESFVLVSTDKAVRPTNLMGASKRVAELGIQALAQAGERTRFSIVRFGNVLGSSGSVIPLFREQIAAGGPVTVTHPEITRYFMTIPEAAQLVMQAGAQGRAGEVFVLDMGEPVRIVDLATRLIRLSGRSVRSAACPSGDIAIEFSGLRAGEKLYEELLVGGNEAPTQHPRIRMADEPAVTLQEFRAAITRLREAVDCTDVEDALAVIRSLPVAYQPVQVSAVA